MEGTRVTGSVVEPWRFFGMRGYTVFFFSEVTLIQQEERNHPDWHKNAHSEANRPSTGKEPSVL